MDFKKEINTPQDLSLWRDSRVRWCKSELKLYRGDPRVAELPQGKRNIASMLADIKMFAAARLFFFSKEMSDLAAASEAGMRGVNMFDLVPTKTGVVWFSSVGSGAWRTEEELDDDTGNFDDIADIRGLGWDFTDEENPKFLMMYPSEYSTHLQKASPKTLKNERSIAGKGPVSILSGLGVYSNVKEFFQGKDEELKQREGEKEVKDGPEVFAFYIRKLIAALSLLGSRNLPDAQERKIFIPGGKVKGKTVKAFRDTVSVVNLRTIEHRESSSDKGKTLTCRFIVGGHWRNQPYKSTGEVKRIFIDPYIKGPADAPLKLTKPVYKF